MHSHSPSTHSSLVFCSSWSQQHTLILSSPSVFPVYVYFVSVCVHMCVFMHLLLCSVKVKVEVLNFGTDGLRRKGSHAEAVSMIRKHVNHKKRER